MSGEAGNPMLSSLILGPKLVALERLISEVKPLVSRGMALTHQVVVSTFRREDKEFVRVELGSIGNPAAEPFIFEVQFDRFGFIGSPGMSLEKTIALALAEAARVLGA
ncbi:MAG: hypothetical protein ACYCQK_01475 [Acidiferrobacteraceae bacterium]